MPQTLQQHVEFYEVGFRRKRRTKRWEEHGAMELRLPVPRRLPLAMLSIFPYFLALRRDLRKQVQVLLRSCCLVLQVSSFLNSLE